MLTLALVEKNPTGDAAITLIGVAMLVVLAVVLVALWVFVASKAARPDDADAEDPALTRLRRWRFVAKGPRGSRRPGAAVVSELDRARGSEPTGP